MLIRFRSTVVTLCLVAGAIAGALWGPSLLQNLYETISEAQLTSMSAAEGMPTLDRTVRETMKDDYPGPGGPSTTAMLGVLGAILGGVVGVVLHRGSSNMAGRWESMHPGQRVNVFLGVLLGLLASIPFIVVFTNSRYAVVAPVAMVALVVGLSLFAIYVLRSMEDVLPWMRRTGTSHRSGIKLLDSNVIIDGRVYDVARAGFLDGRLYVAGFVLDEIQHIADSADALRRQRGRRGLDVLRRMQSDLQLDVGTHDHLAPGRADGVDGRLVQLAKSLGADIVTNDFNLNRVARLQNVNVLNLNDLTLALRPNVMPGESLSITIIREGSQPGQGVGYLDDGTMVVVERGRDHMNEGIDVQVSQVIQTERGRMVFAELRGSQ